MTATTDVATMIGFGQRTTTVPTLRQPRVDSSRLGSSSPNRDPTTSIAGARVSAAATTTNSEIAQGSAILVKYGSVVNDRHIHAPAIVNPEPRMTCQTPSYAS